jgi:hypothetical protein
MKSKLLHDEAGQRTFAVIFDEGDEVVAELTDFAARQNITAARFSAIGAFSDATVRYFDWSSRTYQPIHINEQVEVLVLSGDLAIKPDGKPKAHIHVVLGKSDASAHGGDLGQAHVRPTLELILNESPAYLRRRHDARTGLSLIDLD